VEVHKHHSNNFTLTAPEGQDEVYDLSVTRTTVAGHPAIISFWIPNQEELQSLIDGHPVALVILGYSHPPVSVAIGVKDTAPTCQAPDQLQ
jgi:hypothetical protein